METKELKKLVTKLKPNEPIDRESELMAKDAMRKQLVLFDTLIEKAKTSVYREVGYMAIMLGTTMDGVLEDHKDVVDACLKKYNSFINLMEMMQHHLSDAIQLGQFELAVTITCEAIETISKLQSNGEFPWSILDQTHPHIA